MPSGMTETQRTVFALILLTYLCVDVKELPAASASKVFSPDEAWLRKNCIPVVGLVSESLNRASSLNLVGVPGFEPGTLRLSSACSNQLSYTPEPDRAARPLIPSWWS
jgi:hypothetical protein